MNNHAACGEYVKRMYAKSAQYGILPACVGKPWPGKYTSASEPEGYDYFHELINVDEGTRAGGGIAWAMMGGLGIGMPPVLNFGVPGDRALQDRVVRECRAGEVTFVVKSWFDSVMRNQEEKKVETPMVATAALSRAASRGRAFSTARAFGTSARAEMSAVSAAAVKELRDKSGAGMMLCKKALTECNGDMEEAVKWLRKKGMASADKKAGRVAAEGAIHSYIHGGSRLGVLVEVNCETDFVARGDKFKELVADIAMQVAASPGVEYVSPEDADPAMVAAEKELMMKMEDVVSKPENIREKIIQGRLSKVVNEKALLKQPFIKDPSKTVEQLIKEVTAEIGEKISVRRFVKYNLGEGIEKKVEDFAAEVEATRTAT